MSWTGNAPTQARAPRVTLAGLEACEEWIGVHGSIAAGKSELMARLRAYLERQRCDATNPAHIDAARPQKLYVLAVEEPVDAWEEKLHRVAGCAELQSTLEVFCGDMAGLGFEFQWYVCQSRTQRLAERLAQIAPASFARRIIVVQERTPRSDRIFYETVSRLNQEAGDAKAEVRQWFYDQIFATQCDDMLARERRLVYVPTAPLVCAQRKQARDRKGEALCDLGYLRRLDAGHLAMVEQFEAEQGAQAVLRMDEFAQPLTLAQMDTAAERLMAWISNNSAETSPT